jgi:hypothetical protein
MPPHKKRIPSFGDDARRRAVISGLAADACGLSGSATHVRLPSGRRHAERSRCGRRNPEHARYRGAADVGVEHPEARATLKRRELINRTACAHALLHTKCRNQQLLPLFRVVPRAAIWIAIVERLNSTLCRHRPLLQLDFPEAPPGGWPPEWDGISSPSRPESLQRLEDALMLLRVQAPEKLHRISVGHPRHKIADYTLLFCYLFKTLIEISKIVRQ